MTDNDPLKRVINYFHPAGRPFIAGFALVTFFLLLVDETAFFIGLILTAWCLYFFRDPQRVTPVRAGLIVSPADGKVVAVRELVPSPELGLGSELRWRVSIFLNVFDVHVNRVPADGIVTATRYRPGKFINAAFDKASDENERMAMTLKLTGDHPQAGKEIGVVQIAGLIARRIKYDAKEGDNFKIGERYGIIRFGSRAEVYLPSGIQPRVAVGQYMIGGETIIADCLAPETGREWEER